MKIYKLQIPNFSSLATPPALVYDKDRSKKILMPVTKDLLNFMDGETKKFVYGSVNKETNNFEINREAPWQSW